MTQKTTRRAGRPKQSVLSRDLIFATALRLLDERGETGAGMRDIARELGVQPSALYNHVSGQEELVGGVRELVSDRIDVSMFREKPWVEATEQWARSYREAFSAHPPTIALLAVRPLANAKRTGHMYDEVCAGLEKGGWPVERVLSVVVALECFILGSALDQVAPSNMLEPGEGTATPSFREAYDARVTALDGAAPADAAFELGLQAMLAGLQAQHALLM